MVCPKKNEIDVLLRANEWEFIAEENASVVLWPLVLGVTMIINRFFPGKGTMLSKMAHSVVSHFNFLGYRKIYYIHKMTDKKESGVSSRDGEQNEKMVTKLLKEGKGVGPVVMPGFTFLQKNQIMQRIAEMLSVEEILSTENDTSLRDVIVVFCEEENLLLKSYDSIVEVLHAELKEGRAYYDSRLGNATKETIPLIIKKAIEMGFIPAIKADDLSALSAEYNREYVLKRGNAIDGIAEHNPEALLKKGAREFIESADERDVSLSIASSTSDALLRKAILKRTGLLHAFDPDAVTIVPGLEKKMDAIHEHMMMSAVSREDIVFVDDAVNAVKRARERFPYLTIVGMPGYRGEARRDGAIC